MNIVFIAQSLDGYIAGPNNELDWLDRIPNPEQNDMGYVAHMNRIDALVMGRKTFEVVMGFDIPWPYDKPVFVLSKSLKKVPDELEGKVEIVGGPLKKVLEELREMGHENLYIDGGQTIQRFLKEDLIDEMQIATLPTLLGDGIALFGKMDKLMEFDLVETQIHLNQIVSSTYKRKRN